jgi:phosphatidylglycerol---prolipoprotein diacylglyceryl transferase
MIWNINPDIIAIGGIRIRWYGVMFALSFTLGYQIMKWMYVHEKKDLKNLDQLLFYLIGGTIIGARLGHCFFYDPGYYLSNPVKIFAVWEGGLASHGGGIGVLLALYLYKQKTKDSYLWLLDRVAIPRHPAQVYEALSYILIFFLLMFMYKRVERKLNNGTIFGVFLVLVFTSRFFIEFVKTSQEAYSLEFWMSTGQTLSIPFIFAGVMLIFVALKKNITMQ